MKKTSYTRKALLMVTLVVSVLMVTACGNRTRTQDSRQDSRAVAEERNEERFDSNKQEKDANFLVDAAEMNLRQIQLAQLAQQRGQSAQVKELGRRMEETYTKAQRELTALAGRKNITIPTSPTDRMRSDWDDLNDKTGNDFDQKYADMLVSNHEDAIKTYENATSERHDADINRWAIATLPELRTNLNHSLDFQRTTEESRAK